MSDKVYLIKNGLTVLTDNPNKFLEDGWVHKHNNPEAKKPTGRKYGKKIKLQNKDGDTIEVWDYQVDEYAQQGWSTESAKPKKKSTKITEEQGE